MNENAGLPEHILCDTTFTSLVEASLAKPHRLAHWPVDVKARLDAAVLAVSVFTVGELRSGRLLAGWGERRIEGAERALASYLFVPLDFGVLDRYVELRARFFSQLGDNDMWIAATALSRGWPLVTCDLDYCLLKDELKLIYLPAKLDSAAECP